MGYLTLFVCIFLLWILLPGVGMLYALYACDILYMKVLYIVWIAIELIMLIYIKDKTVKYSCALIAATCYIIPFYMWLSSDSYYSKSDSAWIFLLSFYATILPLKSIADSINKKRRERKEEAARHQYTQNKEKLKWIEEDIATQKNKLHDKERVPQVFTLLNSCGNKKVNLQKYSNYEELQNEISQMQNLEDEQSAIQNQLAEYEKAHSFKRS